MRATVCSVALRALLIVGVSLTLLLVQTRDAAGQYGGEQSGGHQGVNPLAQHLLEQLFEQLQQQNSGNGQEPGGPGTTAPNGGPLPQGDTGGQSDDDVQVADQSPPVIRVAQEEFVSTNSRVLVRARITDDRAVAGAVVLGDGIEVRMSPVGGARYEATLRLPPNYDPVDVRIEAWDRSNKRARPVQTIIRRNPVCGYVEGISVEVVKRVQSGLARLKLYDDDIDGLAGPNTCNAIDDAGKGGDFFWPNLLEEIGTLVDIAEIGIVADAPEVTLSEVNAIRVRVIDPGETGRVASVRMLVDGNVVDSRSNDTGELGFMLVVAEGARHRVTFEALDREKADVLAATTKVVTRPAALRLDISAPELAGARLESEAAQVSLWVDIAGAETGRIARDTSTGADREVRTYSGQPVRFVIEMPPAGTRELLVFQAESGNRRVPPRRIELVRINVPVVPEFIPEEPQPPVADTPPGDLPEATLPPERPVPAPPLRPPALELPIPQTPPPHVPATPDLPEWLAPVAVAIVLVFGMVAGMISLFRHGFRRQPPKKPTAALIARVEAVPDTSPEVEVTGADLPGLVLTVEPGARARPVMEFEHKLEVVNQ